MPLERNNVTPPARFMLPVCIGFFAIVGINFAAGTFGRASASPMLRYANTLMPIPVWGGVFIACSLLMAVALIRKSRFWYRYGLLVCVFSMAVWSLVAIAGIFAEPVSYSAWAWPAFIGATCWALNKSLAKDTQDRRQEH